jgi:hypothetical protein
MMIGVRDTFFLQRKKWAKKKRRPSGFNHKILANTANFIEPDGTLWDPPAFAGPKTR